MPPDLSSPGHESDRAAVSGDRAASAEWCESAVGDLPLRPVSHRCSVRIRRMDDPEILARVLEGLINLT
jgi:hypothetical protein